MRFGPDPDRQEPDNWEIPPITLVTKPTATEEVRNNVIRLLREALAEAEAGKIDTVVMILGHPNKEWTERASETLRFSEAIGRLEIVKYRWLEKYNEGER